MMNNRVLVLLVILFECNGFSVRNDKPFKKYRPNLYLEELNPSHWANEAASTLRAKLETKPNRNVAKNVILLMGDGMSISTLAATRVYMGNRMGLRGEEARLVFEDFPYTGLSKTYCLDKQVADSACSATAYLCGVKTNYGTVGLSGAGRRGVCESQVPANQVDSIAAWAQRAGKKTGFVTTTRVTHASPAGVYAHTADRTWESDTDLQGKDCVDIARQLISGPVGSKLNVIMGGGRKNFFPKTQLDRDGAPGYRSDGRDLIDEWLRLKSNHSAIYLYDRPELMKTDVTKYQYLMGLFSSDHMKYHLDADPVKDPTLPEMTAKAVEFLESDNKNGYFLFVEGGKIDMAHHETKARKALDETAQFADAVAAALSLVDLNETLVIVTADHSHTMTYNGYNKRGSDVLGLSEMQGSDSLPYTILSYANGPGFKKNTRNNLRYNLLADDLRSPDYKYPSAVPMQVETHAGEDVALYATGPWSELFSGVTEQSYIPHAAAFAACLPTVYNHGNSACSMERSRRVVKRTGKFRLHV